MFRSYHFTFVLLSDLILIFAEKKIIIIQNSRLSSSFCPLLKWHDPHVNWIIWFSHLVVLNIAPTYLLLPLGKWGWKWGWFPLGNGVCLIMKKATSDSPIWQLKKRELLLPLSFLITKHIKLDLLNLHYGSHYKPHYRTQGCMIRENKITTPLQTPLRTL